MPQSSILPPRCVRRILPLATCILFLGGCDGGGGGSNTAEFPKMEKKVITTEAAKPSPKALGRTGSDSVQPK